MDDFMDLPEDFDAFNPETGDGMDGSLDDFQSFEESLANDLETETCDPVVPDQDIDLMGDETNSADDPADESGDTKSPSNDVSFGSGDHVRHCVCCGYSYGNDN